MSKNGKSYNYLLFKSYAVNLKKYPIIFLPYFFCLNMANNG